VTTKKGKLFTQSITWYLSKGVVFINTRMQRWKERTANKKLWKKTGEKPALKRLRRDLNRLRHMMRSNDDHRKKGCSWAHGGGADLHFL